MDEAGGPHRLDELEGRRVVDAEGGEVGHLADLYVDDATGEPEWGLVAGGDLGRRKVLVPLPTARLDDPIRLSMRKDVIAAAPDLGGGDELSQADEQRLAEHYGLRWTDRPSPTGLPVAGSPPGTVGVGDPVERSEHDHRVHGRSDPDTDEVAAARHPEDVPMPAATGELRTRPSTLHRLRRWVQGGG